MQPVKAVLILALLTGATSMLRMPVQVVVYDEMHHKEMPHCDHGACVHDEYNTLWMI
jgi:hypothetical protein